MTAPAHADHPVEPPPSAQSDLLGRVVDLLLIAAAADVTAVAIGKLLKLPAAPVLLALKLSDHEGRRKKGSKLLPRPRGFGQVQRGQARTEMYYRAAFLVAAARRMAERMAAGATPAEAVAPERRYWTAHERARRSRQAAAHVVAEEAAAQSEWQGGSLERGPVLLGWHAAVDDKVTPECRAADGANFRADRMPLIGWPGTLHGGACRCVPGPPFATERTVDGATAHLVGRRGKRRRAA